MKTVRIALMIAAAAVCTPAMATHPGSLGIPFASRGECESATAALTSHDVHWLPVVFPDVFDTGLAASFLARAFTCERGSDGQWYIADHRVEVLDSDWFAKRSR